MQVEGSNCSGWLLLRPPFVVLILSSFHLGLKGMDKGRGLYYGEEVQGQDQKERLALVQTTTQSPGLELCKTQETFLLLLLPYFRVSVCVLVWISFFYKNFY